MKGQDVFLLLKLICLERMNSGQILEQYSNPELTGWIDGGVINKLFNEDNLIFSDEEQQLNKIELVFNAEEDFKHLFTVRGLSNALGISKSEISKSLNRCLAVHLVKINRINKRPEVNKKAFFEFIQYGLRYVFPVKPAEITRGIPTTFSAPVLNKKLLSAGDLKMVWPDSRGKEMGQSISPIYKSVPFAVRKDSELYSYLALLDAIRIGNVRESNLALKILREKLFNESKHVQ